VVNGHGLVVAPHGVAATVQLMRMTGLDLVCPYPRQLADGALPRAMALAERASALAPTDPSVMRLIEQVAAGGRTRRRAWGPAPGT
jgi:hypothetical protein